MDEQIEKFNQVFSSESDIKLIERFYKNESVFKGKIELTVSGCPLVFDVQIPLSYPLGVFTTSIRFVNTSIWGYLHQNTDGSICLHPTPDENIERKLLSEIQLLRQWVKDYYIEQKKEPHYSYLLIKEQQKYLMLFEGDAILPTKGSYGFFEYMKLGNGILNNRFMAHTLGGKSQMWSSHLKSLHTNPLKGMWVYIEDEPVIERRKVAEVWSDLQRFLSRQAIDFIYKNWGTFRSSNLRVEYSDYFFLMLGYKIQGVQQELHWELIKIPFASNPIYGIKNEGKWDGEFTDEKIQWCKTMNISYERYFGRGKLSEKITEKKILILGVGAIGSSLAKNLAKGGVKHLTLCDFDVVESGNICRAEFDMTSIGDFKTDMLFNSLITSSPFIEVQITHGIEKVLPNHPNFSKVKSQLKDFDLIFDCSTDMEMAYMLDKMGLKAKLINISITDKAKELAFIVGNGNIVDQKHQIFASLSSDSSPPLFYPETGCQYPTFEASYNDIQTLLSYALKQMNYKISNDCLNSFVIITEVGNTSIKMHTHEF